MGEQRIPRGLYNEALASYESLRPVMETSRHTFYDLPDHDWRHLLEMARCHLEGQISGASNEDGHVSRCKRYLAQLERLAVVVKVEQRPTEFVFTYGTAQKRAKSLRNDGWNVSTGMMRRKDGKDFYVRAWRSA